MNVWGHKEQLITSSFSKRDSFQNLRFLHVPLAFETYFGIGLQGSLVCSLSFLYGCWSAFRVSIGFSVFQVSAGFPRFAGGLPTAPAAFPINSFERILCHAFRYCEPTGTKMSRKNSKSAQRDGQLSAIFQVYARCYSLSFLEASYVLKKAFLSLLQDSTTKLKILDLFIGLSATLCPQGFFFDRSMTQTLMNCMISLETSRWALSVPTPGTIAQASGNLGTMCGQWSADIWQEEPRWAEQKR